MSQITTHILDTAKGCPAAGIRIVLLRADTDDSLVASGITNADGRIPDLLQGHEPLPVGIYSMRFETAPYFERTSTPTFYPYVEITFHLPDAEHYHIPLLISPYGYTTYRGS